MVNLCAILYFGLALNSLPMQFVYDLHNQTYTMSQWKESFSKHLWFAFVIVFLAEILAVAGLNLLAQISDRRSPSGV